MKLIEKLAAISAKAFVEKDMSIQATKDPNGRKYAARSEAAVLEMLRPLLAENRVHELVTDVSTCYVDSVTWKVTVRVTFYDLDSDETLSCVGMGTGVDKVDKDAGKAFTYAVKNAYLKAFNVVSGEDTDNESSEVTEAQARNQAIDVLTKMWGKWYFHDQAAKELEITAGEPAEIFAMEPVAKRALEMFKVRETKAKNEKIGEVMHMTNTMNTLLQSLQ